LQKQRYRWYCHAQTVSPIIFNQTQFSSSSLPNINQDHRKHPWNSLPATTLTLITTEETMMKKREERITRHQTLPHHHHLSTNHHLPPHTTIKNLHNHHLSTNHHLPPHTTIKNLHNHHLSTNHHLPLHTTIKNLHNHQDHIFKKLPMHLHHHLHFKKLKSFAHLIIIHHHQHRWIMFLMKKLKPISLLSRICHLPFTSKLINLALLLGLTFIINLASRFTAKLNLIFTSLLGTEEWFFLGQILPMNSKYVKIKTFFSLKLNLSIKITFLCTFLLLFHKVLFFNTLL